MISPLHALGAEAPKQTSVLDWESSHVQAFNDAKSKLAAATMLVHPDPAASIALTTDTSDTAVGEVLSQGPDKQQLAFFSKKLSTAELKYSAFDRELLALYLTIKHFRDSHEGRCFAIFIDNKPLCGAITSEVEKSPRQTRHLSFIAEYSTDIRHVSGSSNVVADALSRPAIPLDVCDDTPAFFGDSLGGSVSLCPGLDLSLIHI